jgi:hypothetical protein
MKDHYTDIKLILNQLLRYSEALLKKKKNHQNSIVHVEKLQHIAIVSWEILIRRGVRSSQLHPLERRV